MKGNRKMQTDVKEKALNFIEGFLILLPFLIAGMGDSFM